jgi:hypothetical protein
LQLVQQRRPVSLLRGRAFLRCAAGLLVECSDASLRFGDAGATGIGADVGLARRNTVGLRRLRKDAFIHSGAFGGDALSGSASGSCRLRLTGLRHGW